MSAGALFAVLDNLDRWPVGLRTTDRLVAVLIANRMNDQRGGWAWCSALDVARRAGLHPGTVYRSIDRLAGAGVVEVQRRPGRSPMLRVIHNPAHCARGSAPQPEVDPAHSARPPAHSARRTPRTVRDEPLTETPRETAARHGGCTECGSRWVASDGECPNCGEGATDESAWAADA